MSDVRLWLVIGILVSVGIAVKDSRSAQEKLKESSNHWVVHIL